MPFALVSVSYAAKSIISCTTAFLRFRQLAVKLMSNMDFGHVMPHVLASVPHDANGVINDTNALLIPLTTTIRCNMKVLV